MTTRGGVLLSYGDASGRRLGFLPVEVATRVTALGALRRVPGLRPPALGIALADGEVVTVLALGAADAAAGVGAVNASGAPSSYRPGADWSMPGTDRAVVCSVGGQRLAFTGGTIVATGLFEAASDGAGVVWRGQDVPLVDVRAIYRAAETAIWEGRARGAAPAEREAPR